MKERGLIFTGESIPGLQSGAKTQSRRVIMPRKGGVITGPAAEPHCVIEAFGGGAWNVPSRMEVRPCRYGVPGDLVWVKETWAKYWKCPGVILYRASATQSELDWFASLRREWSSPYYMSKADARIWLELTGVRVERLQAISEEDAVAEGVAGRAVEGDMIGAFAMTWDLLNEKRGFPWESNPWVWVLEFRLLEGKRSG